MTISKVNLKNRIHEVANQFQPTNAERIIAWQQRMQRNQRAIRHGIAIAFPLPIIRV